MKQSEKGLRSRLLVLALVSVIGVTVSLVALRGQGQPPGQGPAAAQGAAMPLDMARELALKVAAPFTLAASGDVFGLVPGVAQISAAETQGVFKILRDADVAFANQETNIGDLREFSGPTGAWMGPKEIAAEVKSMGFDIVSRGNNVSMGSGVEGMHSTDRYLDEQGIVHGGTGRTLEEARSVVYLQTPKGRVGMVSLLATAGGGDGATPRFGSISGEAGVNTLRVTRANVVTAAHMDALRKIRSDVYENRKNVRAFPIPPLAANEPQDRLDFFGMTFKTGSRAGDYTYTMNRSDLQAILRSIRQGKQYSDFLITSVHSLDNPSALGLASISEYPADYLVDFAHQAIDNGADVFLGHGVHVLRGMEIYKGKPIFYGLHTNVYQIHQFQTGLDRYGNENPYNTELTEAELNWRYSASYARPRQSNDNMESIVAEIKYNNGRLVEVRVHPLDMGINLPISQRGTPRLASPEVARRTLERLQLISKPFGTTITIDGSVGVMRPSMSTAGLN